MEYKLKTLNETGVHENPMKQFQIWFDEALHSRITEPNAMMLATSSKKGELSSRIVLLKELDENGFYFFTNYLSKKGLQILENPNASLLFFWPELERQVRLEGIIEKISASASDQYFESRPEKNKIAAWSSQQSKFIESREQLENQFDINLNFYANKTIPRPEYWGGYLFKPVLIEFWQGRENRLHDRIVYLLKEKKWTINRLQP